MHFKINQDRKILIIAFYLGYKPAQGESRQYTIGIPLPGNESATFVEAQVNYHLLDETRCKRISYQIKEPIHYSIYQQKIAPGKVGN